MSQGKPADPRLKMTPMTAQGCPMVSGYGPDGFRVGDQWYGGAILLMPTSVSSWAAPTFSDLAAPDFSPFLATEALIDIVLVGTGARFHLLAPTLKAALAKQGLSVDSMDSAAAARTFNVLIAEDRRVGALLYPCQ